MCSQNSNLCDFTCPGSGVWQPYLTVDELSGWIQCAAVLSFHCCVYVVFRCWQYSPWKNGLSFCHNPRTGSVSLATRWRRCHFHRSQISWHLSRYMNSITS